MLLPVHAAFGPFATPGVAAVTTFIIAIPARPVELRPLAEWTVTLLAILARP